MHGDSGQAVVEAAAKPREGLTSLEHQRRAAQALRARFPASVQLDVALSELSQWRVGGQALCVFRPASVAELAEGLGLLRELGATLLTIGSTTNLLFSDAGLSAILVQITPRMGQLTIEGTYVACEAGAWVPGFVHAVGRAGLTGIEHAVGIPGTLGGLIYMNGGSQRKGIGEHIQRVFTLTRSGEQKVYGKSDCRFSYRASMFQSLDEIITGAEFELAPRAYPEIRAEMRQILRSRRLKFPRKQPNCGSVFVSDPSLYDSLGPPGTAIEMCGLKGLRIGNAQISPLHANFIVNLGGAAAADILGLVWRAYGAVLARSGCGMKAEAIFVEPSGRLVPAHVKALELHGDPA